MAELLRAAHSRERQSNDVQRCHIDCRIFDHPKYSGANGKEAVKLGLQDGSQTAGSYGSAAPAIGKELLRRFGGDDAKVKHAIMDETKH